MLLERRDKTLDDVARVLIEYHANVGEDVKGDGPAVEEGVEVPPSEGEEQRAILGALIEYLLGLEVPEPNGMQTSN